MSVLTIVLVNIAAAATLSAILAAVMLAPRRLRPHLEHGYTHRQKAALRAERRPTTAEQPRRGIEREPAWQPIRDV